MNTEDKRVVKTKKAIRDALLRILEEKPVAKITVKEISEAACINRKTFYMHYNAPEDILDEMENEIADDLDYYSKTVIASDLGTGTQQFLQMVNSIYSNNPKFFENLMSTRNYSFLSNKLKKVLKSHLLEKINYGPEEEIKITYAVDFFIGGVESIYVNWLRDGKKVPFEEISAIMGELILKGTSALTEGDTKK